MRTGCRMGVDRLDVDGACKEGATRDDWELMAHTYEKRKRTNLKRR